MLDLLKGKRRQGTVVTLTLAGIANPAVILTLSTFASMVGVKIFVIKRLKFRNVAAGNTWLHIGTGITAGTFLDAIPALWSLNNTTDDYAEGDLPEVKIAASITAWPAALLAGGTFDIQIEVEELG